MWIIFRYSYRKCFVLFQNRDLGKVRTDHGQEEEEKEQNKERKKEEAEERVRYSESRSLGVRSTVGGQLRPKLNIFSRQSASTVKEKYRGFWKKKKRLITCWTLLVGTVSWTSLAWREWPHHAGIHVSVLLCESGLGVNAGVPRWASLSSLLSLSLLFSLISLSALSSLCILSPSWCAPMMKVK